MSRVRSAISISDVFRMLPKAIMPANRTIIPSVIIIVRRIVATMLAFIWLRTLMPLTSGSLLDGRVEVVEAGWFDDHLNVVGCRAARRPGG